MSEESHDLLFKKVTSVTASQSFRSNKSNNEIYGKLFVASSSTTSSSPSSSNPTSPQNSVQLAATKPRSASSAAIGQGPSNSALGFRAASSSSFVPTTSSLQKNNSSNHVFYQPTASISINNSNDSNSNSSMHRENRSQFIQNHQQAPKSAQNVNISSHYSSKLLTRKQSLSPVRSRSPSSNSPSPNSKRERKRDGEAGLGLQQNFSRGHARRQHEFFLNGVDIDTPEFSSAYRSGSAFAAPEIVSYSTNSNGNYSEAEACSDNDSPYNSSANGYANGSSPTNKSFRSRDISSRNSSPTKGRQANNIVEEQKMIMLAILLLFIVVSKKKKKKKKKKSVFFLTYTPFRKRDGFRKKAEQRIELEQSLSRRGHSKVRFIAGPSLYF